MGSRPRRDEGFALVSAVMLMLIVLLVSAVGATAVVRSFDEANQDRASTSAFEAADAAVEILHWRMNKQLTASEIENLGGLTAALTTSLGCTDLNVEGLVQVTLTAGSGSCELMVTPGDGPPVACESDLAPTTVLVAGTVDITALSGLLSRDIVCSSTVNGSSRRIFSRIALDLTVAGTLATPTSLWEQAAWEECPVDPAAACPPS